MKVGCQDMNLLRGGALSQLLLRKRPVFAGEMQNRHRNCRALEWQAVKQDLRLDRRLGIRRSGHAPQEVRATPTNDRAHCVLLVPTGQGHQVFIIGAPNQPDACALCVRQGRPGAGPGRGRISQETMQKPLAAEGPGRPVYPGRVQVAKKGDLRATPAPPASASIVGPAIGPGRHAHPGTSSCHLDPD